MTNCLLKKCQLNMITLEEFRNEYENGLDMTFKTDFSFEVQENDEVGFLDNYDDADVFRQGSCQLFALALHRRFGYQTYELTNGNSTHWFCKGPAEKGNFYIDVRGICTDIETFTSTLCIPTMKFDLSIEYDIEQEVPTNEIDKVGLAFAEWIIRKFEPLYTVC